MSAETSGDVTRIQDEDVLRKMWQDTNDFGKKKEIRTHMYRLREERLKNFYSNNDSTTNDIQKAQNSPSFNEKTNPSKESNGITHADSLVDHSFLSLKSKEIRDSESPTRDMHYRVTADKNRGDQGWNVTTKNETSPDGKTHSTTRMATTSGTDQIDGGVANYAAKCEQKASVYNDGDANNFTKSVAASSKSVIQQEAKGGDGNSNFQTSSTSTSSSSKTVTHHQSSSGDAGSELKALPSNVDHSSTVVRKVYTTEVPTELKRNPNYVDGSTTVTSETRTLPDGSKVTTTRYETRGGKTSATSSSTSSSSQKVSSEQKFSSTQSSSSKMESHHSSRTIQEGRNVYDNLDQSRIVKQIESNIPQNFDNSVQIIRTSDHDNYNQNRSQNMNKTSSSTVNVQKTEQVTGSKSVDIHVESNRSIHDSSNKRVQGDDTCRDDVRIIKTIQEKEYLPRDHHPQPNVNTNTTTTTRHEVVTTKGGTVKSTKSSHQSHESAQSGVKITKIIQDGQSVPHEIPIDAQPAIDSSTTRTTSTTRETVTKGGTVQKTHDVRGSTTQDDVRIIKVTNESNFPSRNVQPQIEYVPDGSTTSSTTTTTREVITKGGTVQTKSQDVRGSTHNEVHITKTTQGSDVPVREQRPEIEYIPTNQQPITDSTTTSTTTREIVTKGGTTQTRKTQDVRGTTQDDVHITRVIKENEYLPRQFETPQVPRYSTTGTTATTREVVTKGGTVQHTTKATHDVKNTTQDVRIHRISPEKDVRPISTTHDEVHVTKIIREKEYVPGDRTPGTPGDRTPAVSTPGDRTPIGRLPGDHTPNVHEIVTQLRPVQEKPSTTGEKVTTVTTTTTKVQRGDQPSITDDYPRPARLQREPSPQYEAPERREPIKPAKSELDQKTVPTEGQYETTYRTDYVNRKISVDVSPTHDAFARSLRAISPDRDKKRGSTRSLKSSTSSLRSSTSPEKYPREGSPTKRRSPDKFTSSETITKVYSPRGSPNKQRPGETNTDTITKRRNELRTTTTSTTTNRRPTYPDTEIVTTTTTRTLPRVVTKSTHVTTADVTRKVDTNEIDSSTLTKRPKPDRPRPRSPSPTSVASDIEFIQTTDLDAHDSSVTTEKTDNRRNVTQTYRTTVEEDRRPSSLDVTTVTTKKTTKKITDRSPTSPITDMSSPRKSPTKDKPHDRPLRRRDTYEERCRQILGITDRPAAETKKTTTITKTTKTDEITKPRGPIKSPEKPRSPSKDIHEFPSQIRRSPEKPILEKFPTKTRPGKEGPKIQEFPSQIRRSPEKQPLEKLPEKRRPSKEGPKIQEYPGQVRRSPEKQPLEKPSERTRPTPYHSKIQEFPSQIRRSPERRPLEKPSEKIRPTKDALKVQEFPSQIRRSPERQVLDKPPEKTRPTKEGPKVQEFPSQIRRSPERQSFERPPEKVFPTKEGPKIQEFPSQIRRSPERQPFEKPPEKTRPTKEAPKVQEYPSQIRRTPDRQSPERSKYIPKLGNAPGEVDEPLFTKKFVSTLCPEDNIERTRKESPDRFLPQRREIPLEEDSIRPRPVIKKGSPERPKVMLDEFTLRHSPERKQPSVSKTFIDTERTDTDITIKKFEPRRPSPDRKVINQITEIDEERRSRRPYTEITDDQEIRTDSRYIKTTDEYGERTVTDKDTTVRRVPTDRKSPEGYRNVIDQYTKTTKTVTKKPKRPGSKPTDSDEETTESEDEGTRTDDYEISETTTTTVTNGKGPKSAQSPKKPGITEYPSQKPKQPTTPKSSTKVTTTTTRKDKKEGRTTSYDVDTKLNEVDDTVHVRTHRIDDYYTTTKTNKPLTNGDAPKSKTTPKKYPSYRPEVIEYPGIRTPERKPTKPTKPSDTLVKVTKRTEITTRLASPEKRTPTREVTSDTTRKSVTRNVTETSRTRTVKQTEPTTKRHVVTTTIQVTPKTKPEAPKKFVGRTTTTTTVVKTTKPTGQQPKPGRPKKYLTNGRAPTEEDSDTEITEVTSNKRITTARRTTSDQVIKSPYRTPVRGQSKPELLLSSTKTTRATDDKTTKKTDKKVITTKSIIINNDYDDDRKVVVNLQRSTSSKESSPNRICPRPISEDEDTGTPRYPDQISEPDDTTTRRKPTRLSDIPIIESEDTKHFTRITQVNDDVRTTKRVDRIDKTDDSYVIKEKVTKFFDEAGKITSPTRKTPKPIDETVKKFSANERLTINRDYPERPKSPKCKNYPDDDTEFTSVSEKVSHFIETAEKVKGPQKTGPAPKVKRPDFTNVDETIKTDDCLLSVSDKVNKFSSVHKLGSTDYKKPVSLAKIDITPKRETPTRESPRRESPRRDIPRKESPVMTECVQIENEEQTFTRFSPDRRSPIRRTSSPRPFDDKTPRRSSTGYTRTETQESRYVRKDSSVKEPDSTPKSSRKDNEPRSVLSPTGRLRSTESIRKAKELFENIAKEQKTTTTTTKQRDILSRPSVFDKSPKKASDVKLTDIGVVKTKLHYSSDEEREIKTTTRRTSRDDKLKSTRLIWDQIGRPSSPNRDGEQPGYLRPLDRSPRPHSPYDRSRSPKSQTDSPASPRERSPRPHDSALDDVPHYMWPLDRTPRDYSSDRSRSRSRESTPDLHGRIKSRESSPDRNLPGYMRPLDRRVSPEPEKTNKFGVTLRKTDSGRTATTTTTTTTSSTIQQRKLSAIEIERMLSTQKFEEIYDLEILEILLERAINYEQRRRIRSQIRIVKQLIAENKLSTVITTVRTTKTTSPVRGDSPIKHVREKSPDKPGTTRSRIVDKSRTEYQTEYTRKSSPPRRPVDNKMYQHSDIITTKRGDVDRKSEYQSSYSYSERRTSSEVKSKKDTRGTNPDAKVIRGKSPEKPKTIRRSPDRKTETTESRSVFKTELKRTTPVTKTVVDDKPSWITQKTLRKTTEVVPAKKSSVTTTTTTTRKQQMSSSRTSPLKERKSTDAITSSYGVGPTDENGSPLFGLKALRAQNRTESTKVQGTVIRSHYHSENGQEPVGEVSVTKYSSDPRDLEGGLLKEANGIVSVTTTQKFGSKGTPSYKSIVDKKKITDLDDEEECETVTRKTTTTKVSRRGSVKEMSKKFIENAVETSKNERQSSYPKAGLILRTSSFKDTAKSTGRSRESSPEKQETVTTTTVKKTTTSSSSGGRVDTFLNNKTRVRDVHDVITRMKNADEDVREGESAEDAEARSLLNKFIGSQVILSGMEARSTSSSTPGSATVKRTTTTTTTSSRGGGKPKTVTRTFTHPITESDLETVWDEDTLKLLLERSTDYEERRLIRARLRDVMAEQEVCADVVSKAKEENAGERVDGESLLLPLLQGLLDAPDNEQTADSGTESGEDLRSGLLVEVQNVLTKLANSLKSDNTDMTQERRSSLLQLVLKLQSGLSFQPAGSERRGSAGAGRFARKRRQNRHTVGVTSEELEDARKLMEEFGLCDTLNAAAANAAAQQQLKTNSLPLQRQNSEGNVLTQKSSIRSTPPNKASIKNATAKPYGSSASTSQSHSGASSSVETPTEPEVIEFPCHKETQKKPADNPKPKQSSKPEVVSSNFLHEIDKKSPHSKTESETDEDPVTVKAKHGENVVKGSMVLQSNPIYSKPSNQKSPEPEEDHKHENRYMSKKLKMKRANTIDIPKPLEFYESEDDYDSDTSAIDKQNRRNNYFALRGPIRVGRNAGGNTNVPAFEPKTDSDRKFMAFINKHNDNSNFNKASLWASQTQQNTKYGNNNWSNRFGNIKTAFEKASNTPTSKANSAKDFWKSADDAVSAGKQSYNGPKVSKQGVRNLQQTFEDRGKEPQQKTAWSGTDEKNIVTGTLKVDTKGIDTNKNYKFVPQPSPVNKFSHAPNSAFAAIPKKVAVVQPPSQAQSKFQPVKEPENLGAAENIIKTDFKESDSNSSTPLYLYSPKPLQTSPQGISNNSSPSSTPWVNSGGGEHRVQKLAASKFESVTSPPPPVAEPTKVVKKKSFTFSPPQTTPTEPLNAPYLVKSADKSTTVKKLSNQFETSKSPDTYSTYATVKYAHTKPTPQTQPQNYSISYSNQQHQTPPQKQVENNQQKYQSGKAYQENQYQKYQSEQPNHNYQRYNSQEQTHGYQKYPQEPQKLPSETHNYQKRSSGSHGYQKHPSETHDYQKHSSDSRSYQKHPSESENYQKPSSESHAYQKYPPEPQTHQKYPPDQPESYQKYQPQPQPRSDSFKARKYLSQQSQESHNTPKTYQTQTSNEQQPQEYTSQQFIQFNQTKPVKSSLNVRKQHVPEFSSPDSSPTPPQKPQYQRQSSQESVKEYEAAVTRVMKGPVSHQAVTVQQKGPKNRDEHDMEAAFNLKSVLQKFSQLEKGSTKVPAPSARHDVLERKLSIDSAVIAQNKSKAIANLQRTSSFKKPNAYQEQITPNFLVNGKPLSMESTEINEDGEAVITSKFHIPVTISKSQTQTQKSQRSQQVIKHAAPAELPSPTKQMLSKADSWHQLMHQHQQAQQKPAPPSSKPVVRSKSSHTLAVPTVQYQAGMTKDEVAQKRRTVEAYFTGKLSPQSLNRSPSDDSLDRSDKEKVETTKKTDGPAATTEVTTTKITSQQTSKKPVSPFAKFRQLDKQNSLNSPGTPRTPTGSRPLFKFTDPELSRQASTVKDRLLQWCQMKTKEYENISLDNFSSSWSDGLAFCALIHHFLPDAFDYHALTPKDRRHNFTLAFRVADEKADILPLLDVDDMVATRRPDWKCVFTYVQTIYSHFKDQD